MNLGKKIFLLTLLLLLLIVSCVYRHTKEFMDEGLIAESKVVKDQTNSKIQTTIPTENKSEKPPLLQSDNQEKNLKNNIDEQKVIDEKLDNSSEKITNQDSINKKEEIKKPEPIQLIRIDKGYRRSNGEFFYYELSPKSKAIQDKLYNIMRDEKFVFVGKEKIEYTKKNDEILNKIIKIMNDNPNLKFEIAGHVLIDKNNEKYNKYISVMRAANIKKELISRGISKRRMKGRGYGSKIPLIQDKVKLINRIEFNIIGE
ncbi:OmpA family protein [Arcobacter sp. CECT 8985]|uniref:OmpA family protein n=1 Tax=Arcobacter sp. CECT 8985 TaxID=1935424 RepID=UPI00100C1B09|nr:OmpA family protein [Arcobacter sp. CECT 8985]RXJ86165.1 hypothetical protein CRU93_09945 [Arcobacter sp. CECT 8985]